MGIEEQIKNYNKSCDAHFSLWEYDDKYRVYFEDSFTELLYWLDMEKLVNREYRPIIVKSNIFTQEDLDKFAEDFHAVSHIGEHE